MLAPSPSLKSVLKMTTPLSRKATLTAVNISAWSARKFDRRVTQEVTEQHNAADDAGRFNKLLLNRERLSELTGLISEARQLHYKYTQPWADEGPRVLANALFQEFANKFRVIQRKFEDAADRFEAHYERFVNERKTSLGDLFNEDDYPAPSEIRARFKMEIVVLPFPDAEDFRSDLDEDTIAEIKASLNATTATVADKAMAHIAKQITDVVGHMAKKLAEYKPGGEGERAQGVFKSSLVENVRELAEILPALNYSNDPRFDALVKRIESELCVEDAAALKEHEHVRASVQKSADEIIAEVSGLFA